MMTPGPDHPITLEPGRTRWRAMFNSHVIADTDDALVLREADYPKVVYFPRSSVAMEYMARTDRTSHCPFKGDASYYTIRMDGRIAENAAWSYEEPFDAMERIAGRIAFYTDEVDIYSVDDAAVNPHHHEREHEREHDSVGETERAVTADRDEVDEIVQHTDSGAGRSQKEHWQPNVETPGDEYGGLR